MVLHDVAEGAGPFVEAASLLDAERLGHGDLDVVDVAAVPERLEDGVGEAQGQDVLDRLLAEVVVDPVDLRLVEGLVQGGVELAGAGQVAAERLLDHQADGRTWLRGLVEAGAAEAAGHWSNMAGTVAR